MTTLVMRWSSLGDVVLAGAVTGGLGEVWFWTKPAWAELAARLPGVERVIRWGVDPPPKGVAFERIVDLQGDLRARRARLGLRGPVSRVDRYDLRRRLRVWLKWGAPPPRVVDRYAAAAGVAVAGRPWLDLGPPGSALGLVPGATWPSKRWTLDRWVALARRWEGPVVLLGGPEDARDLGLISRGLAEAGVAARVVSEAGFTETLGALADCALVVANDTGLLHLAGAAGRPVVGLFGPTTSADGFWCHEGEAVELSELACRPCSRHGERDCPFGDHACLRDLDVDTVWAAVQRVAPP